MTSERSVIDVIRDQHILELGTFMGMTPIQVRKTLTMWFTLLAELGYRVERTGANRAARDEPTLIMPEVSQIELYQAIESTLQDVTERRDAGERISDQAEVRALVASVLECLPTSGAGNDSASAVPHQRS
jgi:hypothetical protein